MRRGARGRRLAHEGRVEEGDFDFDVERGAADIGADVAHAITRREELRGERGGDGRVVGGVAEVDFKVAPGRGARGERFADAAGVADGAEIFEGVGELRGGVTGGERGVAGDGGGAGNKDIGAAGGAGNDAGAGETGRARAVLGWVGVGGDLTGIFEVADRMRARGEDDGEIFGLEADGGGGGKFLGEGGAEGVLKGKGATAAERPVVFEARGAGRVDPRNVVPDTRERAMGGGEEEIAVETVRGGFR